jgi:hypothetical protein
VRRRCRRSRWILLRRSRRPFCLGSSRRRSNIDLKIAIFLIRKALLASSDPIVVPRTSRPLALVRIVLIGRVDDFFLFSNR